MKTIDDEDAAEWLRAFVPEPASFDWDDGNRNKNLKHGISDDEIESILRVQAYFFAGKIIEPINFEWRGLILGQTESVQMAALIFTRRGEKLRPICCRSMRNNERRKYEEETS